MIATINELKSMASRLPHNSMTSDEWELLEILHRIGLSGDVSLVKVDGIRDGSNEEPRYTVMVSGPSLADDYIRRDDNDLGKALRQVISEYLNRRFPD